MYITKDMARSPYGIKTVEGLGISIGTIPQNFEVTYVERQEYLNIITCLFF